MKFLFLTILLINMAFGAVIDDYLASLKQEALKENPNFKGFDAKRGEEIFTSKHMGKKGKEISCIHVIQHNNDCSWHASFPLRESGVFCCLFFGDNPAVYRCRSPPPFDSLVNHP